MKSKRALFILAILIIAIAIRVPYLLLEVEVEETFRDYYTLHELQYRLMERTGRM